MKKTITPLTSECLDNSAKDCLAFLGADDGCMRSLTAFEMTAGEGREDSAGKSRRQCRKVEMTVQEGREDSAGRSKARHSR